MPKSKKKRANPFVELYGFRVDRIVRSTVAEPLESNPGSSQEDSVPFVYLWCTSSWTDSTRDLDEHLDPSVEICSNIEVHEE